MDAEKREAIKQVRALMQELGVTSGDILLSEAEEIFLGGIEDLDVAYPNLDEFDLNMNKSRQN